MRADTSEDYPGEVAAQDARKRRIYVVAAAVGIAVLLLSILARDPDDVVLVVTYPVLAVTLVAFIAALHWRWAPLAVLERIAIAVVGAAVLGRLAWHLHFGGHIDEHLLVLAGGHYWSVGALVVAGFVLLDRRAGLRVGIGVLACSALLVVTGAGPELVGPDGSELALIYLVRVHGFLVLLLVLTTAVATLREQLHRALARSEALEELASTDPLTGLANRRAAMAALAHHTGVAAQQGSTVSVVTVDVDHFKDVNDTHGHQRGDEVLVAVARLLADNTRDVDVVARWGGEEFLVVAPDAARSEAAGIAERCRAALADGHPAGLDVTATFGVAELAPGEDVEGLLLRADQLLYDAKRSGRDRVITDTRAS